MVLALRGVFCTISQQTAILLYTSVTDWLL